MRPVTFHAGFSASQGSGDEEEILTKEEDWTVTLPMCRGIVSRWRYQIPYILKHAQLPIY